MLYLLCTIRICFFRELYKEHEFFSEPESFSSSLINCEEIKICQVLVKTCLKSLSILGHIDLDLTSLEQVLASLRRS